MELAKILQKRNHLIIHSGWGKTWPSFAQAAGNPISKQPVQSGGLTSKAGQNWTQVTELRHGRRTVTGGLQGRPVRSPRGLGGHTRQPPWTGARTDRPNLVHRLQEWPMEFATRHEHQVRHDRPSRGWRQMVDGHIVRCPGRRNSDPCRLRHESVLRIPRHN